MAARLPDVAQDARGAERRPRESQRDRVVGRDDPHPARALQPDPVLRQQQMPDLAKSDAVFDSAVTDSLRGADANDVVYQLEASRDYDPAPGLDKIRAPLVAINFADDLINPQELGILEREIKRVPHGRALVIPMTPQSRGHGTHTVAAVWKEHLAELLRSSAHD